MKRRAAISVLKIALQIQRPPDPHDFSSGQRESSAARKGASKTISRLCDTTYRSLWDSRRAVHADGRCRSCLGDGHVAHHICRTHQGPLGVSPPLDCFIGQSPCRSRIIGSEVNPQTRIVDYLNVMNAYGRLLSCSYRSIYRFGVGFSACGKRQPYSRLPQVLMLHHLR